MVAFPLPGSEADEALLMRIGAGDEQAFTRLFDRYRGVVFGLLLRMLANRETAEEALMDVFTRVWKQAADYQLQRASVKTWLLSIARHRAIDLLRMRHSHPDQNSRQWAEDALETISANNDVENEVLELDMRLKVQKAIAKLPQEQREVLALAYFRGWSHSEIAKALNQPLGTVKTRIRLAMSQLREKLEPER